MFWNLLRSRRTSKARRRVARPVKPTFRPELEALELKLLLSNHVWTGHGSDDHWSNDANWDTGQPGPGDTAVFNGGVSTVDPAFGGTIGGLVLNGGVLRLGRDLTLTGSSTWSTGDINAGSSAPTSLINNGTLTLATNGLRGLSGLLTNNGEIDYSGNGIVYMSDTAHLENTGTFVFEGTDSELANNGAHSTFTNTGTIIQSGTGTGLLGVAIFNNTGGSIDVQSGLLQLGAAAVNGSGGSFAAESGATLDLVARVDVSTYSGDFHAAGPGAVRLDGGALAVGASGASFDGDWQWWAGEVRGGSAGLTNNGTLTLISGLRSLTGLLTNNGEIDYSGNGIVYMNDTADLENAGTFVFEGTDSELANNGPHSTFINTGTVIQSGTGTGLLGVAIFNNTGGSIDAQSGLLQLGAAAVNGSGGSFAAESGATLDLVARVDVSTYKGDFHAAGPGAVRLDGGALAVDAAGASFDGDWQWWAGEVRGGSAGLTNNGTLTLVTNGLRGLSGVLTNNGEIDYNGSGGGLYMNDTADLENAGTFVFEGTDSEMWNNGPHSIFTNTGTVSHSGTGTGLLGVAIFNNTGVVDVQSGALNLLPASGSTTGGTFMMDVAEARLNFGNGTQTLAGATFTGDGRAQVAGGTVILSADVSAQNFGMTGGTLQVNPGVTLTVTGDYTQTGGTLEYDIAGPSSYGQLVVTGRAALGGYLRIRFLNGYTPQVGDSFQVLTYGSRSGDFGDDFPQLDGRHLREAFDPPDDPNVPGSLSIETVQGP